MMSSRTEVAREILRLAEARAGSSFCPSEVARHLAGAGENESWRELMPLVREVAASLAVEGAILVTQRGLPVKIGEVRGAVRLRKIASSAM